MSEQPLPSVVVHIVTFNSSRTILPCLESALGQQGFELDANLLVAVTDNASIDDTSAIVLQHFGNRVQFTQNSVNLGFCAAHNHGINTALSGGARYVLLLNPDCRLAPDALAQLVSTLENDPRSGAACPKLLRANAGLEPVVPHVFDSSGMYITPQIRHFDRASQQLDYGQHDCEEYVFGASGAAILLKSHFIEDAALPPLSVGMPARLFDEAFFAYREDADLAWRALRLGWKCRYVPQAAAFHERVVLPENRKALPAELNAYSVRNRFLLQFNNFSFWTNLHCLPLMILRNILVILGALFVERSSLPGLRGAYCLLPQARRNRLWLAKRERICPAYAAKWFSSRPYSEPLLTRRAAAAKIQSLLIVIINYNSGSRLTECLKSLSPALRGMMPQIHARICVVDNASTDLSAHRLEPVFSSTRLFAFELLSENLGFAGAINFAVKKYPADAVLVLNPDVYLREDTIGELTRVLDEYAGVGAVAPMLYSPNGKPQTDFVARRLPSLFSTLAELFYLHRIFPQNRWTMRYRMQDDPFIEQYFSRSFTDRHLPHENPDRPLFVEQPPGACLLIRGAAFMKLCGFDESFWPAWFEDVDFCKRLAKHNYSCAVLARASAIHDGGYSLESLPAGRFSELWYTNLRRYWKKHGCLSERCLLGVMLPLALLLRSIICILDGIFPGTKAPDFRREKLVNARILCKLALRALKPLRRG